MAKEYRRKKNARPFKNQRQVTFVLVAFLFGYLTANLFSLGAIGGWVKNQVLASNQPRAKSKSSGGAEQTLPKPKFEFYTLLTTEHSPPANQDPVNDATNALASTAIKMTSNKTPMLPPTSQMPASKTALIQSRTSLSQPKPKEIPKEILNPAPALKTKESYLLQVAAFRNRQDAEKMKASLTLKGFNVNIATISQQNTNWYRVIIGPFVSKMQAERAQIDISRSEHTKGMIRKLDA